MKRNNLWLSFLSVLLFFGVANAVETFSGEVSGDEYFSNGVLLEDVESTADGVATVTVEGTGSLTIGNQAGGGFPRVSITGGTVITSTRTFGSGEQKTTWEGQFSAPGSRKKPEASAITFVGGSHSGSTPEVVSAYGWGLANEVFGYVPAARVVLPVDEQSGQKLWVAYPAAGGKWTIQEGDFCVVEDGLCYFAVSSVGSLALVKELYTKCPKEKVENGTVGKVPNCIVSCDDGFMVDENGIACIEADMSGEDFLGDTAETSGDISDEMLEEEENALVLPEKEYDFPPGHFRYRASKDKFDRILTEEGLTEEEALIARHQNSSFLSRNPRTAMDQLGSGGNKSAEQRANENSDFMTYLLQMRNQFSGNSANKSIVLSENGDTTAKGGTLHASAGTGKLLPSTGPGLFLMIAIVGFALMLFGGARRS